MIISNRDGQQVSLQVSIMGDIPVGLVFTGQRPFLVKNISSGGGQLQTIPVKVKLASLDSWVNTVMFPGWNPELCQAILVQGGADIKLQYGY